MVSPQQPITIALIFIGLFATNYMRIFFCFHAPFFISLQTISDLLISCSQRMFDQTHLFGCGGFSIYNVDCFFLYFCCCSMLIAHCSCPLQCNVEFFFQPNNSSERLHKSLFLVLLCLFSVGCPNRPCHLNVVDFCSLRSSNCVNCNCSFRCS